MRSPIAILLWSAAAALGCSHGVTPPPVSGEGGGGRAGGATGRSLGGSAASSSSGGGSSGGATTSGGSSGAASGSSGAAGSSGTGTGSAGGSSSGGGCVSAPSPFTALDLIAGQSGGAGSSDGSGTAARFSFPSAAVSDGQGTLYVADTGNDTIRAVALATGAVTTLAGAPGVAGLVDGSGTQARFNQPGGLALDGAGNLFVADTGNGVLRQVALASGTVTTLPTPAFKTPDGLAADGKGDLFVSDYSAEKVYEVTVASGATVALAGSGNEGSADGVGAAADFDQPYGLAYDGSANLYVADSDTGEIRQLAVATGTVTTVAGDYHCRADVDGTGSQACFDGPKGLALDGAGNLFVADSDNRTIRQVVLASGAVTTVAGAPPPAAAGGADGTGSAATFASPVGVAWVGAGLLVVADAANDNLRQVAVPGFAVTTLAGSPPVAPGSADGTGAGARFDQPWGVVFDGQQTLYVADTAGSAIRAIDVSTGAVTTFAGRLNQPGSADGLGAAAGFFLPEGLALDGQGHLFVADSGNGTVRQVDLSTAAVTTLAGTPGLGGTQDGTGAQAGFLTPTGLAWDGAGNLFVTDFAAQTIRRIVVATKVVSTLAGTPTQAGSADGVGASALFDHPTGIASDGQGDLFVADGSNDTLREINVAVSRVTTLAGRAGQQGSADCTGSAARFYYPQGLAYDGAGNLFIADSGNATIRELAVATGEVRTVVGLAGQAGVILGALPAGLNYPQGLAFALGPVLYIADGSEGVVLAAK
ncbi:MAG: NHL repeat-containing protein [Myxococcales bacterium]